MVRCFHRLSGAGVTLLLCLSSWWSIDTIAFHYEKYVEKQYLKGNWAMTRHSEKSASASSPAQVLRVKCKDKTECI
jgi:hypothetical protein